jgi:carboxypeptidase family protein
MRSLVLFFLAAAAFAQNNATVTGTVLNLPGEKVANAPVQLTNTTTKQVYQATSSNQGGYTVALPAGAYDLSVTVLGYNPFAQKNVMIAAGRKLQLDIHLVDYQFDTLGDGKEFRIDLFTPHETPKGATPRTREGKPDFTGVWYAQRTVDPGKPDMLPWAEKVFQERSASNSKDAPGSHCLPRGINNAGALFPYEIVQTSKRLVMLFEDDVPSHRSVYLDGRKHPKDPNPNWMGHSIGHWEGDVMVIDTIGFNDKSWLDIAGHPHTESMHVTERIHRPDLGHLEIEFTIEDKETYKTPWVIKRVADLNTKDEVGEYVCAEGEKDAPHLVGR